MARPQSAQSVKEPAPLRFVKIRIFSFVLTLSRKIAAASGPSQENGLPPEARFIICHSGPDCTRPESVDFVSKKPRSARQMVSIRKSSSASKSFRFFSWARTEAMRLKSNPASVRHKAELSSSRMTLSMSGRSKNRTEPVPRIKTGWF